MTKFIVSDSNNPYENLALENHLYNTFDGEPLLYLWQNASTVVIGKWQNAYREVNFEKARELGIRVARRTTGGGAVYHHLGNLNFTFIMSPDDYDVAKQLGVIGAAAASFNIEAKVGGRNDLTVDGQKFSGNAFKVGKHAKLHHGTVLIDENVDIMSSVLTPSPLKLRSKGVSSVRSRVINLKELNGSITVTNFGTELKSAFERQYGKAQVSSIPFADYKELYDLYSSDEWILGSNPPFDYEASAKCSFGEISVCLSIAGDTITAANVYTDALDLDIAPAVQNALKGIKFTKRDISDALHSHVPDALELAEIFVNLPR